jgi:hypothetical protein
MKTLQEKIAVMQAFADGKKIELCDSGVSNWRESINANPSWNWYQYDYRVKHDPVVVERVLTIYTEYSTVWAMQHSAEPSNIGKIKVRLEDGKLVSVEIVK